MLESGVERAIEVEARHARFVKPMIADHNNLPAALASASKNAVTPPNTAGGEQLPQLAGLIIGDRGIREVRGVALFKESPDSDDCPVRFSDKIHKTRGALLLCVF